MFDDFAYDSIAGLEAGGWTIRTSAGWPGSPEASWGRDIVDIVDDPATATNGALQLSARIGKEVRQSQVCHRRKYLAGTYAARVRFSDLPVAGIGGDRVVESFYGITPYERPLDPAYSELDFEYLPNGGWGLPRQSLVATSWETVQIEPWVPRNASTHLSGGFAGWHLLVVQVTEDQVLYSVDGRRLGDHAKPNYPTSYMSINFNVWCIDGGKLDSSEERIYTEEVDWVFFAQDRSLDPSTVEQEVDSLRTNGVKQFDNVPEADPPLDCPCDM